MAEVTQLKRYDARPINWGKWFLIGIGMLVSAFILLVPMIYIFVQAFSKGLMPVLQNLADPDMLHAIWLTVMIALIAVPVNLVFGILLAWLVTRFNFPGRQLLLTLLDIPFAVSPVVAGLVYLLFYGSNGPLGGWLDEHNLQIMFSWPGMARLVRGQILFLREQEYMVAAEAMGYSTPRKIFKHLVPNILPQILVSMTLSLGSMILYESTLSYLNLGVRVPYASWGTMIEVISRNLNILKNYPNVWVPSGICIIIAVLGFNFIGDGLRDALDPRQRR